MSKYKTGDKVVLTIIDKDEKGNYPIYVLNDNFYISVQGIDKYTEPLTIYTEQLEDKISRQEAEITRLLAENKELKETKTEDIEHWCDICTKQSVIEEARAEGQNEAWELARKIILNNGYSIHDLYKIFGYTDSQILMKNHTYPEAAAKVEEWKNPKEEIKDGDVLEGIYDNNLKCIVTNLYTDNIAYLMFDDGTAGFHELNNFKKTGRHIDIDSFLKQIGGE